MSFVTAALIGAGGAIVGGLISSRAAGKAADVQAEAARESGQTQRDIFERQVELQEPWRQAGIGALNKLIPLSDYKKFSMADYQADPGYAFRMSEGMKALERSAAARGGLLSGGTLKATQRFGQDLASQEYQNAFNRYQAERAAQLQPLQALAGVGQTSANTLTTAAGQLGQNLGEATQAAAAARASGYVGGANALTSAIGTGLNYYQGQNYLNALRPTVTATPGYSYGGGMTPVDYSLGGGNVRLGGGG
jgi:hypothetical protein